MNRATLQNIVVFMERAACTGREALGWSETYQAVHAEIAAIDAALAEARANPPVADSVELTE